MNEIGDLLEEMHPRGAQNTEDEIHDLLKAYYEASPKNTINKLLAPYFILFAPLPIF